MKIRTCINRQVENKATNMKNFTELFQQVSVTPKELLEQILKGYSYCPLLKAEKNGFCYRKNSNFISTQIISVDIDNTKSKKRITEEEGYFSYEEALEENYLKENASFIYQTPSHKDVWHRFRVVFVLDNPIEDTDKLKEIIKFLNSQYYGDISTVDSARGFYGSKGAEHTFWGNTLSDDNINEILEQIEKEESPEHTSLLNEGFDTNKFSKEEYVKMYKKIFKNGNIEYHDWFKVVTISKNYSGMSNDEIKDELSKFVDLEGIDSILTSANKYKDIKLGTLLYIATSHGYTIPYNIRGKNFKYKFWDTEIHLDNNSGKEKYNVIISACKFENKLNNDNYRKYTEDTESTIVKIKENIMFIANKGEIRASIINYLGNTEDLFINEKEKYIVNEKYRYFAKKMFSETLNNLKIINDDKFKLVRDTEDTTYLYYKNGFRSVGKDFDMFKANSELPGYRWANTNEREYRKSDGQTSMIEEYVRLLATKRLENDSTEFIESTYNALVSAIGYLVSTYKTPNNSVAIILLDSTISETEEGANEGGVGKSLFCKIFEYFRNIVKIDGRKFRAESDTNLSLIENNTNIVLIDDAHHNFNFSNFFNSITNDLSCRKLFNNTKVIPFKNSPKFIFTTNSVIGNDDSSTNRRKLEIEINNYFSKDYQPSDHFKTILFDWEEEDPEWSRLDDFIRDCIQYYKTNGLVKPLTINVDKKRLEQKTSKEFVEFAEKYLKTDVIYKAQSILERYNNITNNYITLTLMTRWLKYWVQKYKKYYYFEEYIKKYDNMKVFVISKDKDKNLKYHKNTKDYKDLSKNKKLFKYN